LDKPEAVHDAPEMPHINPAPGPVATEALRSESYSPRSIDRNCSHPLILIGSSTLPTMLRIAAAGLRTFILVPLFFVLTMVFASIIIIYGAFRPASPIHDKILRLWSVLYLRIPPVQVELSEIDIIDPDQRYVIISNHLSMFDIPLLIRYLPLNGRFLAKTELFKIPLFGQGMRTVGIIEINRSKGGSSREAINEGVRLAGKRGNSLIVFPEGTRGTQSTLLPFHKGAFRIAIDTALPILPVIIEGTDRISKPGSPIFFPGRATLTILDPIDTTGLTNKDDLASLTETVETEMNRVYDNLRHTTHD
jgi:1-acyl-sn-glycerol-3-phosphate acyltransferase